MEKLLIDIKQEMKLVDNIIVVVTGDIVHKGNYNYKENAIAFFKELKKVLKEKGKQALFLHQDISVHVFERKYSFGSCKCLLFQQLKPCFTDCQLHNSAVIRCCDIPMHICFTA